MEFGLLIQEPLPLALNISHKLREGGANIATIVDALNKADFPEHTRRTAITLLKSEEAQGYKRPIGYEEQPTYP